MSQPPPPNQPPPGGYGTGPDPSYGYPQTPPPGQSGYPQTPPPGQPGYPQTPPPDPSYGGGYPQTPPPGQPSYGGYPQTPPPDPSYGYPQTPPPGQSGYPQTPPPGQSGYPQTPPPGQSSYGYPQTPPPGGYPGSPTAPQPAYPTQGGYPQPGAPSGGGRSKMIVIVAAAVAVLLAVGGGVWFFTQEDDGKKDPQAETSGTTKGGENAGTGTEPKAKAVIDAELAWQLEAPKIPEADILTDAHGTWFAEGKIIKALPSGVVAYNMDSGEEAWTLDLKRPKDCGVSLEASENKVVVMWGPRCEKLAAVDIAQGKLLWQKDLPSDSDSKYEFNNGSIGISGNTVAVNWSDIGHGYQLADGSSLWSGESTGDCYLDGYMGGKQLLARYDCYDAKTEVLQGLKPNGDKDWEWTAPAGVDIDKVFSLEPLTVGVSAGDSGVTDVMVVRNGKLAQKISVDQERYDLYCSTSVLGGCPAAVVHDDTLFIATKSHEGSKQYSQTNEIVAFDLANGKTKWQVPTPGDGEMAPVGMEDGMLITYQSGGYAAPGKVWQVDPKTRKASERMNLPDAGRDLERTLSYSSNSRPYWVDGHLFLVAERFYSSNTLSKHAILAFN